MQPIEYAEYMIKQFEHNALHRDGSIEVPNEDALVYADEFAAWVKLKGLPMGSVLDAGCRVGYTLPRLQAHFPAADVMGCDLVGVFVEKAIERGCHAIQCDIHSLPFMEREFDWVFCSTVIEHCVDAKLAAKELFRVSDVGCYIITDLATMEGSKAVHPSHYTFHNSTVEWIDVMRDPAWQLMWLDVPTNDLVKMMWVRKEHVWAT